MEEILLVVRTLLAKGLLFVGTTLLECWFLIAEETLLAEGLLFA
jgi:hypothetical protein